MSKATILIETSRGTFTLRQISEITGIPNEIIRGRYYKGWRGDRLLEPYGHPAIIKTEYKGEMKTLYEIAEIEGVPIQAMIQRYRRGERGDSLWGKRRYRLPEECIGKKFGHLTVIGIKRVGKSIAVCKCDCGKECEITLAKLYSTEYDHSCGCRRGDWCRIHGLYKSREHKIWRGMFQRCYNPKTKFFKNYGGRGIGICERWRDSFADFYSDMGPAPGPEFTIDRINNDGDYCPENCRWATSTQQARNTRRTIRITYKGETRSARDWDDYLGCRRGRIYGAYYAGWNMDDYIGRLLEMKEKYGHCNFRIDFEHHQGRKHK